MAINVVCCKGILARLDSKGWPVPINAIGIWCCEGQYLAQAWFTHTINYGHYFVRLFKLLALF